MTIKNHTPESDEKTLYIKPYELSLTDLIEQATNHFGSLEGLTIDAEYIHTRCITYDLYDPSDYDNYIVIRKA